MDTVWYFAYGSNLNPERFRSRVGDWLERKRATLHDYELRFSGAVFSEGGGGAIIQAAQGGHVHGGVYRVSRDQIETMDEAELSADVNPQHRGVRRTITLECPHGPLQAEVYLIHKPRKYGSPSDVYVGHIVKGLRSFGYAEKTIEEVRAIASSELA